VWLSGCIFRSKSWKDYEKVNRATCRLLTKMAKSDHPLNSFAAVRGTNLGREADSAGGVLRGLGGWFRRRINKQSLLC